MLRVSYKNRIGWYTKVEKYPDEQEHKYKNWICHANCLWADMYFYKVAEDYEQFGEKYKKGDRMTQLIGFWADIDHLKRSLKEGNAYWNADNFHFYIEEMDADIWAAVKALAKAGKTITIESRKKK